MADSGKVEADPLFTLDVVRDFMHSQGGKVSNHTLVTHFKSFLNDPQRKDANRVKFKEYVNALSTVKLDTSGEKLLVLKKKFRESIREVKADTVKNSAATDKKLDGAKYAKIRQQKLRAEKEKALDQSVKSASVGDLSKTHEDEKENLDGMAGSCDNLLSDSSILGAVLGASIATIKSPEHSGLPSKDEFVSPARNEEVTISSAVDHNPEIVSHDAMTDTRMDVDDVNSISKSAEDVSRKGSRDIVTKSECDEPNHEIRKTEKRPLDEVEVFSTNKSKNKPAITETPKGPTTMHSEESEKEVVSVRERARHLNTIEPAASSGSSPVIRPPAAPSSLPVSHKTKRDRESRRQEDSSYDTSLNSFEREWMIESAHSNYQAMSKLLLSNPSFARRRDFLTGYTALHWAAKNGSTDVIKLLFGSENPPDVDARSGGGYTALHVAAMHGREEVIELLIEVYHADTTVRDYSGRRPKFYSPNNLSARAQQLLASRRDALGMMSHSTSYNNMKNRPNTLGFHAPQDSRSLTPSPCASPGSSSRKGSVSSDSGLMPPPRELPAVVRRRPVASSLSGSGAVGGPARDMESLSDSEMHRADSDVELHGSESVPNFGSLV